MTSHLTMRYRLLSRLHLALLEHNPQVKTEQCHTCENGRNKYMIYIRCRFKCLQFLSAEAQSQGNSIDFYIIILLLFTTCLLLTLCLPCVNV